MGRADLGGARVSTSTGSKARLLGFQPAEQCRVQVVSAGQWAQVHALSYVDLWVTYLAELPTGSFTISLPHEDATLQVRIGDFDRASG